MSALSRKGRLHRTRKVMKRAVIYARVSTQEQVANFSLETQERECRAFCSRSGLQVVGVFVDRGESAKTINRPEFQRMLTVCQQARNRIDVVVVYALTRFSRENHDHQVVRALLSRHGVTLRSVMEPIDDTASGRLMENIGAALAQYDNQAKSERTHAGMRSKLISGQWPWKAPIGYKQQGSRSASTFVPDPMRADHIRKAFDLCAKGLHTVPQICKALAADGLRTAAGKPVSVQTLSTVLRRPIYAGWLVVEKWDVRERAKFEPLVKEDVFDRAQRVLDGKRPSVTPYARNNPLFPLRRFVRCGRCETPLTGSVSKGQNGGKHAYYHCRRGCLSVRKAELEAEFVAHAGRLKPETALFDVFREVVLDVWKERNREAHAATVRITHRIAYLRTKKSQLVDYLTRGTLTEATYKEAAAEVEAEIVVADIGLKEAQCEELDMEVVLNFAQDLLTNAGRLWLEFDLDRKQRLQKILFPEGLSFADGRFGTAATSFVFNDLTARFGQESGLVRPVGFEPTTFSSGG
jgi:site-specific DNA recombinase